MSRFLDEIGQQPAALDDTLRFYTSDLRVLVKCQEAFQERYRRILFSGMGGSYFATIPAQLQLLSHGIEALAVETSELLHYQRGLITPDTMLVLVSQSGYSAEIVKLLDTLDPAAFVIGITNDTQSPLAKRSQICLPIHAGKEETVSTKTYTSSLSVLYLLAAALTGQSLIHAFTNVHHTIEALDTTLKQAQPLAAEMVNHLGASQALVMLGRGASLASAMTGALVTKETCKFPAEGMSAGQFRHGPMEIVDGRIGFVVFTGAGETTALTLQMAREIQGHGGRVLVIGNASIEGAQQIAIPAIAEGWLLPILEIAPMHYFVAAFASHRGFEPGRFRHVQKITANE
jgi:glutamine---fructose-6-phosphate transaminase (isomerizing)